jgi:hypothetical protein
MSLSALQLGPIESEEGDFFVTQYKTSEQREIGARVGVEGLEEGRNSRNNVSEAKPMIGKGKRSETKKQETTAQLSLPN